MEKQINGLTSPTLGTILVGYNIDEYMLDNIDDRQFGKVSLITEHNFGGVRTYTIHFGNDPRFIEVFDASYVVYVVQE